MQSGLHLSVEKNLASTTLHDWLKKNLSLFFHPIRKQNNHHPVIPLVMCSIRYGDIFVENENACAHVLRPSPSEKSAIQDLLLLDSPAISEIGSECKIKLTWRDNIANKDWVLD